MNGTYPLIEYETWTRCEQRHRARLAPIVEPHLVRASRKEKHPVIDFLFQYYRFSPAPLMRWSPGWGKRLSGEPSESLTAIREGCFVGGAWMLDPAQFPASRLDSIRWVRDLQREVSRREPRFGCFGLHEWAMVYRSSQVRHRQLPFRFSEDETASIVESMPISCSHYDAFRFFTPAARPLNKMQPDLEGRTKNEQRGCLHVNMDLYKWSSMFYPWVSSDLIADCFLLAYEIREVDMRASAYDVSEFGYAPIPIEREEGRKEYQAYQKEFTERSEPLRARLIDELEELIAAGASESTISRS